MRRPRPPRSLSLPRGGYAAPDRAQTRSGQPLFLQVIAVERIPFAYVESALAESWVSPATTDFGSSSRCEFSLELVAGGKGTEQGHEPVLIMNVKIAICIKQGSMSGSRPTLFPNRSSRKQFDTSREAAAADVDMIPDQQQTIDVRPQIGVLLKINLPSLDAPLCSSQLQECKLTIKRAHAKHVVAADDRGMNVLAVADIVCKAAVTPELLTALGIDPYQSYPEQLHVLLDSCAVRNDGRRIRFLHVFWPLTVKRHGTTPDFIAGHLVQRHHGGVRIIGGAEHPAVIDERRLGKSGRDSSILPPQVPNWYDDGVRRV